MKTKDKDLGKDPLGDLELYILRVLWEASGWLDVKDVVARMGDLPRAYTTVLTTLSRLHAKGYVDQQKIGRAFVYRPRVTQRAVIKGVLARLTDLLFNGDVSRLVPQILDLEDELSEMQRQKLRKMANKIKDRDNG